MKSRLEHLSVSAEQRLVLKAFTKVVDDICNVPREPQTYSDIRNRAEAEARLYYGPRVPEGERKRLPFDQIFRTAINTHAIDHVQGGYVITEAGVRQLKQAGMRLDAKMR